jgi:hypothetical protein
LRYDSIGSFIESQFPSQYGYKIQTSENFECCGSERKDGNGFICLV